MATQFQKQVKKQLEESSDVHPDKIVMKSDGSVEVKRGYFYRHGMDANMWGDKVSKALTISHKLYNVRDDWKAWPKDSYFVAVIEEA